MGKKITITMTQKQAERFRKGLGVAEFIAMDAAFDREFRMGPMFGFVATLDELLKSKPSGKD